MNYLFVLLINLIQPDAPFYDIVTRKTNRCYVVINIHSKGFYDGTAFVPNNLLFQYFREKVGYDEMQYKKFIIPTLRDERIITVDSTDFKQFEFEKVVVAKEVQIWQQRGAKEFLDYYFTKVTEVKNLSICLKTLSIAEISTIVKVLFDWQIACVLDDETGYLLIAR
jgi:hypothetical protein